RLIGARPVEIERHPEDAATARVRAVIRERCSAHEVVVRVAQRGAVRYASRIRRRTDVRERKARAPRLEIGHRVPFVARDTAVENAAGRADGRLAVAERIPDEAGTWRDVTEARRNHAALDARITVEKLSGRRGRPDRGLLTRHIGREPVLRIGTGCLYIPAHPEVQRHARIEAV